MWYVETRDWQLTIFFGSAFNRKIAEERVLYLRRSESVTEKKLWSGKVDEIPQGNRNVWGDKIIVRE